MRDYFNPVHVDRDEAEDWSEGGHRTMDDGEGESPLVKFARVWANVPREVVAVRG